jgi:hypothetical protein
MTIPCDYCDGFSFLVYPVLEIRISWQSAVLSFTPATRRFPQKKEIQEFRLDYANPRTELTELFHYFETYADLFARKDQL